MALSTILKKMLISRAFTNERGRIKLYGRMDWSLVPSWVFGDLIQKIGEVKGRKYVYDLGYEQGLKVADEMIKCMGVKPKGGWMVQKAVVAILDFIGFGMLEFIKSKTEKDGHHHLVLHIKDHPVTEHAAKMYGSKSMICDWFMGVYAAHGETELGVKNVHFKENKCVCRGDPYCEWESKW
jgi:predicted hydrocarbon binding protein